MATDPVVRVRFPALPDFLRSSGSGTGSRPTTSQTLFQTHYFSEVVGLEQGPLSLASTIEELLILSRSIDMQHIRKPPKAHVFTVIKKQNWHYKSRSFRGEELYRGETTT
jgi:hypothetical protein